ncbi:MAG: GerMN domain-containing protein [Acidimicrobiales bacterium]
MKRTFRPALAGLAALLLCTLLGCGVPIDNTPAALSRAGIPFHLLAPVSSPHSTVTSITPSEVAVQIFLLTSSGRLVSVQREVANGAENLAAVLSVLVSGPTAVEAGEGLESAIPPQTTVLGATVAPGGLATVDVGGTFGQLVGVTQIQAVAQIVFTATTFGGTGVTSVTFQLAGQPVEVPVDTGAQEPIVNETGFASIAPETTTHNASP